jgi:hypothetical protein
LSEELESTGETVEKPQAVDWLVEEPESAAADRQSLQSSRSDGGGAVNSESDKVMETDPAGVVASHELLASCISERSCVKISNRFVKFVKVYCL